MKRASLGIGPDMTNPLYDALFAPLSGRHSPLLILQDGTTLSGMPFCA